MCAVAIATHAGNVGGGHGRCKEGVALVETVGRRPCTLAPHPTEKGLTWGAGGGDGPRSRCWQHRAGGVTVRQQRQPREPLHMTLRAAPIQRRWLAPLVAWGGTPQLVPNPPGLKACPVMSCYALPLRSVCARMCMGDGRGGTSAREARLVHQAPTQTHGVTKGHRARGARV